MVKKTEENSLFTVREMCTSASIFIIIKANTRIKMFELFTDGRRNLVFIKI